MRHIIAVSVLFLFTSNFYGQGAFKKAEKKLEKILKNEPQHPQALFSMSKCLISQSKYEEAEIYLKRLESNFPEALDVKDLRKLMP